MQAVVLVGGFGTRMRPLTATMPKPMLPVGHRPMIAQLIERLARGGVTEVALALGFKPEPFVEAFPDGTCEGVRLVYAVEPEPLDTAGAIRFAADAAGIDDTFVVANGDIVTDLDTSEIVDFHRRHGAQATIHLHGVDDPSAFGVVDLAADGQVRQFVEKPAPGTEPSNLINAGTYVFEPTVLDLIEPGEKVSVERDTFPRIVAAGGLFALATDDYWVDAGRPEQYRTVNLDLLDETRRTDRCEPISDGASVDDSAVVANSIVGAGATVGPAARVVDSVVLPGAVVHAGAEVSTSVVMGRVGEHASLSGAVIGAEGRVPDGATIEDVLLPAPA